MARRWGSFTQNKTILLNLALVKAPVTCIDYVIMHELCHLREPNHGPRFYRLLSRHMPDWDSRKHRLETFII
jgi:predicted metal-dependent hydrolase